MELMNFHVLQGLSENVNKNTRKILTSENLILESVITFGLITAKA